MATSAPFIIAVDAGNTHVRIGRFRPGDALPEQIISLETYGGGKRRFADALDAIAEGDIAGSVISSVVPAMTGDLTRLLKKKSGSDPVMVSPTLHLGFDITYDEPARLGADRIANAAGAFATHPGRDLLVFDIGTAMTVCVLTAGGCFEGGMIFPGPRTALNALVSHTALPDVELTGSLPPLAAKNTADGMRSGIIWGYAAMIEGLHERFNKIHERSFHPVLTGGAASLVDGILGWSCSYDPDLTMRGLKIIYDKNSR